MSEDTTEEAAEATPAKKKTARKAAKKAAKKAARKTAAKNAKDKAKDPEPKVEKAPAAEAPPKKPADDGPAKGESGEGGEEGVRYGRVPGGGPVQREDRGDRGENGDNQERNDGRRDRRKRRRKRRRKDGGEGCQRNRDQEDYEPRPVVLEGPKVEVNGLLEMAPKGFGFLRVPSKKFEQAKDDVFVSPDLIRTHGLRLGVWIHGLAQEGPRGPQLVEITSVNDLSPDEARKLPAFEELKAINPDKRIAFETTQDKYTTRVVDLMSPVGRGQRGLIVSPPRSGKTTLLLHIAEAVRELHEESMHLMVLLVDERPEEVTEFRRALPDAEVFASSNDEHPRNHTRIAEIAIERAKRLVEGGQHVFLLMDSITRLARAYNNAAGGRRGKGRGIGSGGVMIGALETPRRLFAAARNTREAGSLTILATALIQTNSRADDAIFQEFKGTGNMELVLDRRIAENYIYPAVDIFKSGTRREELLLPEHTLHKIHMIRRGLSGHRPEEGPS
ncbi:MAG: transcription termination factor Rho [Verrucomicrobiota bacterium]